ncbi:MAG: hypothetical protein J6U06_08120 [Spirochaetaceae bacterium]|nr:hypothetical protein [Spirochaetaceae bacterium]
MKRIFSVKRFLRGFIPAIALVALFLLWSKESGYDKDVMFVISPFYIVVMFFAIHFMTAHTAYDSEKVVALSLFRRKSIRFENIIRLHRKWESIKGGYILYWFVFYRDDYKDCELKAKLYLPDNPEGNGVQSLFAAIKAVNPDATLVVDLEPYAQD